MTKGILSKYIEHFNEHVRRIVPEDVQVLLLLDGHKSRQGLEWIEAAVDEAIVVAQSPANTSHYLQAADQDINKIIQQSGRRAKEILSSMTISSENVQFKIIRCMIGYESVSENSVRQSWSKVGLWPMDFRFVGIAREMWTGQNQESARQGLESAADSGREPDKSVVTRIKEIVNSSQISDERKMQQISIIIREAESANSILMRSGQSAQNSQGIARTSAASAQRAVSSNLGIFQPGGSGTPAIYLTSGDYLKAIREKEDAKKKEEAEKAQRRQNREENKKRKVEQTPERKNRRKSKSASTSRANTTQDEITTAEAQPRSE